MTYKLSPNIQALSIPISASPFSCYDYVLVSFIIKAHVFSLSWTLSKCSKVLLLDPSGGGMREGFPQSLLMKAIGGLTSRSTPIQDSVVVVWEGSPQSLLIKATDRATVSGEQYGELDANPQGRQHQFQLSTILHDE